MTTHLPGQKNPSPQPSKTARHDAASGRFQERPAARDENPARLRALAERHIAEKRFEEAIACLEKTLISEPENAMTWYLLGTARDGIGDRTEAVENYRRCVRSASDWAEAWYQLGMQLLKLERPRQAAEAFHQTVALRPGWAAAWLNLGSALDGADRAKEALGAWQHALILDDSDARAHYNCGRHFHRAGDYVRAVSAYHQAIKRAPQMVVAYLKLGICLEALGRPETALNCFRQVVARAPGHTRGWIKLADVLISLERFNEAVAAYQSVLKVDPDNADIHLKLAGLLARRWRIEEALVHCRRALEIRPEDATTKAALYELARHACFWQMAEPLALELDGLSETQLANREKTTEWPLLSLWRHDDPQRNLAVAASWSHVAEQRYVTAEDRPLFRHRPGKRHGPIRIGYLSGDFRAHAVAHQIRGLFRLHDRSRFEIHAYGTNPSDGSDYREQLIAACDRFTDIEKLDGRRAAELIHNDGIDILVDLSGYTMGSRIDMLALRPAPVQMSYLGFLGSSGASCIDYFITDHVVTPPGHEAYYSEKLIYMPHCYQVNDDTMAIADQPFSRKEVGLPPDAVVFCCFNQPFKIDRRNFECWLGILQKVPQSVLWLLDHNRAARNNLWIAARSGGIDPTRLIFSEPVHIDMHLARLQLADLALDTFTYNGGATTANALWAGVPLVALMGNHLVSRMSASALNAVGLPELVARTAKEYCDLAVQLGTDPERRLSIRKKLAEQRRAAPLFDTRLFTRHLERAYETALERFAEGLPPSSFDAAPQHPTRAAADNTNVIPIAQAAFQADIGRLAKAAEEAIERQDFIAAAGIYQRMQTQAPQSAEIHHMLGLVHAEMQKWTEARAAFIRAIELEDGNAAYHHALGNALQALEALDEAETAYRRALKLNPGDADSWINLGNILYTRGEPENARQCYERALKWAPDSPVAMNNMGKSLYDLRVVDGAIHWYDKALRIDPDYAEARFNRAAALLLCGDYQRGWPEYEWRFRRKLAASVYPHRLLGPRWDGRPYPHSRLLVHCEQGLGDVIQFARFLPQAKALGGTLILEAQAPLIPFLKTMTCVDRIVAFSTGHPPDVAHDLHISLQSLPCLFGTELTRVPGETPYLLTDPAKTAQWRQRLDGPGRRVGLVWSCSNMASYRESHLKFMLPLLSMKGMRWFSLQKGPGAKQTAELPAGIELTCLGDELKDFSDTAAVVANLDLLITVDTAVAHVAGALNVPVWVLLPFAGDWRWLLHPTRTPWYPSARLFRQTRAGDWAGVVDRVQSALRAQAPFGASHPTSTAQGATPCESH